MTDAPATLLDAFAPVVDRYGLTVAGIDEQPRITRVLLVNRTTFLALHLEWPEFRLQVLTGRLGPEGEMPPYPVFPMVDGWTWFDLAEVVQVTTGKRQRKLGYLRHPERRDDLFRLASELAALADRTFGPVLAGDTALLDEWEAMLRKSRGLV